VKRLVWLLPLVFFAQSALAQDVDETTEEAAPVPRFEALPCWELDGASELGEHGVRCGYLIVPERRGVADPLLLRLAVAILPARAAEPLPDPVLYLHGGPGGRAVGLPAPWFESRLRDERDIILLDQRGSGLSEPTLCPGLGLRDFHVMAQDHAPGEEFEARKTVALRCRDELLEQGIDLGAWNSTTSALDVEDLRHVLEIEEWNLLGVSYGTRLALAIMRLTRGEGLRSVILDSTYPAWAPAWDSKTPDLSRALDAFFTVCEDDVPCDDAFPDLRMRTRQSLERLERDPLRVVIDDPVVLPDGILVNNAQDTAILIHQMLYDSRQFGEMPLLFDQLEDRRSAATRNMADLMTMRAQSLSRGTNLIVECYERAPFQDLERQARYGEADPLIHRVHTYFDADYGICAEWSDKKASASEVRPVRVNVPTLTFGGRFDPITPPDWGERTARTLPDARHFEFPVGHGAYRSHECPREIAEAFVADPTAALSDGCIARMKPPEFTTRFRESPGTWPLLRAIQRPDQKVVVPLAAGIGALGLGLLMFPLAARVGRFAGRESPAVPPGSRAWVVATASLVLAFWLGFFASLAWTVSELPVMLVVGLPFWTHVLFWLHWLTLPVGAAAAATLWRDRAVAPRSARWFDLSLLLVCGVLLLMRFALDL
jgi:pimeloyl-ACP methyl ester carboxylesterase